MATAFATAGVGVAHAQFRTPMPGPGDKLPDLTIYDDQGQDFQLTRLKGQYTVLVFGCLT